MLRGCARPTLVAMSKLRAAAALLCVASLSAPLAVAQVPDPVSFFGHEVGADYKLINYTDMSRYFSAVEQASDRVKLVDIGPTSYGQRMVMAIITSKANHARLERLREITPGLSSSANRWFMCALTISIPRTTSGSIW